MSLFFSDRVPFRLVLPVEIFDRESRTRDKQLYTRRRTDGDEEQKVSDSHAIPSQTTRTDTGAEEEA
jgi:hypothetical protein